MNKSLSTKEKIVELGRDFIQTVGYHSFKYQQVAKELNIKNAAIHHYFPGKEDLGLAIIKKDHDDFLYLIRNTVTKNYTAKTELLLSTYTSFFKAGKNLCVIGACGSAYEETPEQMRTASKLYSDDLVKWLTSVFKEGRAAGEFHFRQKPEELTALWISALTGALQVSKSRGPKFFEQVLNQLRETYK